MKLFIKHTLVLFFLTFGLFVDGQIAILSSAPSCANGKSGSIEITIDRDLLEPEWELPFEVEYFNATIGTSGQINMSNYLGHIEGLAPGSYELIIFLSGDCELPLEIEVKKSELIIFEKFIDTEPCKGMSNGILTVIPSGGTAPFEFLWNTGSTSSTLFNLGPGEYSVTVTDDNGCTQKASKALKIRTLELEEIVNHQCSIVGSLNDGSIHVDVLDAKYAPYSFSWSNGATTNHNDNLATGTYSLTITDKDGCMHRRNYNLKVKKFRISSDITHPTCLQKGSLILEIASNAIPPFTFEWNDPLMNGPINQDLDVGIYFLTLTDAEGCAITSSYELKLQSEIPLINEVILTPFGCDSNGGQAEVIAENDNGNFEYNFSSFDGNPMLSINDYTIGNLLPGTYGVVVIDTRSGCTSGPMLEFEIENMDDFEIDNVIRNFPSGVCQNDGSVEVFIGGNDFPYQVKWRRNNTWSVGTANASPFIISDLGYGDINLIFLIKILPGEVECLRFANVDFVNNSPSDINISLESIAHQQPGIRNASIDISVEGNYPPFSYEWSCGGSTEQDLIDFLHPIFENPPYPVSVDCSVTVTDAGGCTEIRTFTIYNEDLLEPLSCPVDPWAITPCIPGTNFGAINVTTNGGLQPITYAWTGPNNFTADTEDITGISEAGTYILVVTDAANRQYIRKYEITCSCNLRAHFKTDICDADHNRGLLELKSVWHYPFDGENTYNPYRIEFSNGESGLFNVANNGDITLLVVLQRWMIFMEGHIYVRE